MQHKSSTGAFKRRTSNGALRRNTASITTCCCTTPCPRCSPQVGSQLFAEVLTDITVCGGCYNNGTTHSIDVTAGTISAGSQYCLTLIPPLIGCTWDQQNISPGITGTSYASSTTCSGGTSAATVTAAFVFRNSSFFDFSICDTNTRFFAFHATIPPTPAGTGPCTTASAANGLTSCGASFSIGFQSGWTVGTGGSVSITAGCPSLP